MPYYPVKDPKTGKIIAWDAVQYRAGKRYRKRCSTKGEAIDFMASVMRLDFGDSEDDNPLFVELLPRYISYCQTNKSVQTVRADNARLAAILDWTKTAQVHFLSDFTPAAMERFKGWYLSHAPLDPKKNSPYGKTRGNPKSTLNKYLSLIKAFLNWAVVHGYLKENPLKGFALIKDVRRRFPRYFTKEELEVIFKAARSPYREYFQWLAYTGMRSGELDHLEFDDISLSQGIIKIQSKPGFHPKTYEIRSIPLHPVLAKYLRDNKPVPGQRYIFGNAQGGHAFKAGTALKHLVNILRLNEFPDGNLYSFRHTFASHLVMAGVDIATLKELMGHSTITTTEQYLHVAPERKKAAVERLEF
ncbi:MAG: tyrosine-type recombinase/integrase [Candidatus Zixiibacteriota bacterium]